MPAFNCGNATLPYPNCKTLIKTCNALYITDGTWCNCMQYNDIGIQNCTGNSTIFFAVLLSGIGGLIVLGLLLSLCYKLSLNKEIKKQNQTFTKIDKLEQERASRLLHPPTTCTEQQNNIEIQRINKELLEC